MKEGLSTTHSTNMTEMRKYYEVHKFNNLNELGRHKPLLEKRQPLQLVQEQTGNPNRPISIKETKSKFLSLPKQKAPHAESYAGKF